MNDRLFDESWNFQFANTKEYTHCYHSYPAMMIPQVARTLISEFKPEHCDLLFDPYMGSGTSLVEAEIAGINSVETDLNPLAQFIAHVKTIHFDVDKLERDLSDVQMVNLHYIPEEVKNTDFSRISNYSFWYSNDVLFRLEYLSQRIDELDEDIQLFFKIALSEVVRECSFTRNSEFKRFKMSESQLKKFSPDVFGLFINKLTRNSAGLKDFNEITHSTYSKIYDFNTVKGIPADIIAPESVDLVVTSPPYGDSRTTVAYGQFSRWANEWLGFENAKNLDKLLMGGCVSYTRNFVTKSISTEHQSIKDIDSKRYDEVVSFLNDYHMSIKNVANVVRREGGICYVVGSRTVKGIQIPLDCFTAEMFER